MKKHGHYCKICGEYKANEKILWQRSCRPYLQSLFYSATGKES